MEGTKLVCFNPKHPKTFDLGYIQCSIAILKNIWNKIQLDPLGIASP